jgi:hypothetical protein
MIAGAQVDGKAADRRCGVSFRLGLLLFLVMPTDIITMFTVGVSLTRHGQPALVITQSGTACPLTLARMRARLCDSEPLTR